MNTPWIEAGGRQAPGFKTRPRPREKYAWYEFKNTAGDEAELLLFDEIGGWFGIYADEFVESLKAVTASRLTVRLNSPGGSVFEGIAVANALRAHPAEVTVRVEGLAASIASVIALAGDRLIMAPQSMIMIHDASGGCWGQAADMQQMAEILDKISDNIADAYAAKAGGTRAEWRARMLAETWYSADEAVEAGLADEVARPARQPDQDPEQGLAASWDLSVFRFAGRTQAPAPDLTPAAAAPAREPEPDPAPTAAPAAQVPAPAAPLADPWATAITHLINPPSVTDEWATLTEAL